ncbi:MAG: hypothetical protein AB1486_00020 [Planctomycetota bacterium]
MLGTRAAWGIDYSDGAVKAVRLVRRAGRLVIRRAVRVPYAGPGEWTAPPRNGLGEAEREGLLRLLREVKFPVSDKVVMGFPSPGVFQKVVTVPPVGPDRLEEVARYEALSLLPDPPNEVYLRHKVLRGRTESEIPALCVAVRRDRLDGVVEDLRRLGFDPDGVELEPLAAASFLERDQAPIPPYLALQVGRLRTDLIFGLERGTWTRSLPSGVGALASQEQAPKPVAVARLARTLAREIFAAMAHHFGSPTAWRPRELLLLGDSADLPGLAEALRRSLADLPVETLRRFQHLTVHPDVPDDLRDKLPLWGTALGLALTGLGRAPLGLSLIAPNRAREARRLAPFASCAAFVAGALLLMLTLFARQQATALRAVAFPSDDLLPAAMAARFEKMQAAYAERARPVRRLARLPAETARIVATLGGVLSRFPDSGETGRGLGIVESLAVRRSSEADAVLHLEGRLRVQGEDPTLWPARLKRRLHDLEGLGRIDVTFTPSLITAPAGGEGPSQESSVSPTAGECRVVAELRPVR